MIERDCVRYTIMVPNNFDKDLTRQEELKEVIFSEASYAVIRETSCLCIIKEGEVLGFREWKVSIPLHSADAVFHRISMWAEEYVQSEKEAGRPGIDNIMLEKEYVKKAYLR